MKRSIYKYQLPPEMDFYLDMKVGARVLSAQVQPGRGLEAHLEKCTIWCEVDPDAESSSRHFKLLTTGPFFEKGNWQYVATMQLQNGGIVLHLFEVFD